jgi:hypothetical protein
LKKDQVEIKEQLAHIKHNQHIKQLQHKSMKFDILTEGRNKKSNNKMLHQQKNKMLQQRRRKKRKN